MNDTANVTDARMRETMKRILNDLDSTPWLVGQRYPQTDRLFAVRKEDVYAYSLAKALEGDDYELSALTRDGNVIPIGMTELVEVGG